MDTGKKVTQKSSWNFELFLVALFIITSVVGASIFRYQKDKATLILVVPTAYTTIYIDGKKTSTTGEKSEEVRLRINSGAHTVLASKNGYFPWQKNIILTKRGVQYASVFSLPTTFDYSVIPEYSLEEDGSGVQNGTYKDIVALFENTSKERVSESGRIKIELSEDRTNIIVTWLRKDTPAPSYFCIPEACDDTFALLPTPQTIRNLDFYPEHEDHIIFSSNEHVWVVELERSGILNAQPLFIGHAPEFARGAGNTLYIKDTDALMHINL